MKEKITLLHITSVTMLVASILTLAVSLFALVVRR